MRETSPSTMEPPRHHLALMSATLVLFFVWIGPAVAQERGFDPQAAFKQVELEERFSELRQAGKYAEAIPVGEELLSLTETLNGPDHLGTATVMHNLASTYHSGADYAKAEPLYERSLAIWEKALGPDHPDVATSLENLAELYRATERIDEAEKLEQRAAKIHAKKR